MKPGDYQLGSPESRAAARLLAKQKEDRSERTEIIVNRSSWYSPAQLKNAPGGDKDPYATPWIKDHNGSGKFFRMLSVPEGMTVEEAKRLTSVSKVTLPTST